MIDEVRVKSKVKETHIIDSKRETALHSAGAKAKASFDYARINIK